MARIQKKGEINNTINEPWKTVKNSRSLNSFTHNKNLDEDQSYRMLQSAIHFAIIDGSNKKPIDIYDVWSIKMFHKILLISYIPM